MTGDDESPAVAPGRAVRAAVQPPPVLPGRAVTGTVESFDEHRGLGTVRTDTGPYGFHCTALDDGSRSVETGAAVVVTVGPGHLGDWAAVRVTKVGG